MVQHGLYMSTAIFLNQVQMTLARTAKIVPSAIRPCDYGNGDGVGDDNGGHGDGNSDGAISRGRNRAGPKHFARALRMCTRVLRSKHVGKRTASCRTCFCLHFIGNCCDSTDVRLPVCVSDLFSSMAML